MKIVRITFLSCLAAVWIVACGQDTAEPPNTAEPPSPDPVDSWYNEEDSDESAPVEAVLWQVLGKHPSDATKAELATVTHLPQVAPWRGFSGGVMLQHELDLLAACVNLVELEIVAMSLSNEQLRVLGSLTKLESLKLSGNRISDLSPIARLTNLESLNLHENRISDLSPIARLTNLRTLDISANPIADLRLRPVIELPNLTALSASDIGLTDLRPLAGLVNLEHLVLWSNQIDDLSPLAGLVNLEHLELWGNQIDDLSPLVGLVQLERLDLRNNKIVDIQPLLDNIGIGAGDKIELQRNRLSDISRDQHVPALEARGVIVHN